jgi:protein O-GlcNAc transferase
VMSIGGRVRRWVVAAALSVAGPASAITPAEALMLSGRLGDALPMARAEATVAPDDLDVQERYIDALLTVGLIGLADQTYRARVEDRNDADSWYLFGRALVHPDDSLRAFDHALTLDVGHARSHMGRGAVLRGTGRIADAEAAYLRAVELDPRLGEAWSGLVAVRVAAGRSDEALAAARDAVRTIPSDPDGWLNVATLDPANAAETLQRGSLVAGADPRIHASLAEAWLDRGNGDGAHIAATRALSLAPGMADPALSLLFAEAMIDGVLDADGYHDLLSLRLVEERDLREALTRADGLVGRYPRCALPYMSRARIRALTGDRDGAIGDLALAMGYDPDNLDAQGSLGLLLVDAGRQDEAVGVLARVVQRRPGDATLSVALARAQYAAGDRAGALETIRAIRGARPLHVEAALEHARLLSEAGDRQGAYDVIARVLRDVPDERLVLAMAAAARDLGRTAEAVTLIEQLASSTGDARWADLARRLRAPR